MEGERVKSSQLLLSALLPWESHSPLPNLFHVANGQPLLPTCLTPISHSSTIICGYCVSAKPSHGKFPQVKNLTNFYFSDGKIVHSWALKLILNLNMKMDQLLKQLTIVISWQNKVVSFHKWLFIMTVLFLLLHSFGFYRCSKAHLGYPHKAHNTVLCTYLIHCYSV